MPYRTIDDLYGSSPAPPPWEASRPAPVSDSPAFLRSGEGRRESDENWMLELDDEFETVRILIAEGGEE